MTVADQSSNGQPLPNSFPVCVILESQPSQNIWIEERWQAVGVSAGGVDKGGVRKVFDEAGVRRYLHGGFTVELHADECESYYYNLISDQPRCFIVADLDADGRPTPRLISLSFDEAHAYLEGEQEVYAVDVPPEIYRWVEAYVLDNYVPERKIKRKRNNWTGSAEGRSS